MIKYPISFSVSAQSNPGMLTTWQGQVADTKINCAIPVEFEGPGQGLSPEDLYAQALANCFIATFKVYAQHSKLDFESVSTSGHLIVDLNENKKPVMKSFHLEVQLKGPSNTDKATTLVKKAFESGFVLNSVKTTLSYNLSFI